MATGGRSYSPLDTLPKLLPEENYPKYETDPALVQYQQEKAREAAQRGEPISSFDGHVPGPPGPPIQYGEQIPGQNYRKYPDDPELAFGDPGYEAAHPSEKDLRKDALGRRQVHGEHLGVPLEGVANWDVYFSEWKGLPRAVFEPVQWATALPPAEMDFMRKLGFEFERELGTGGYGRVYRCIWTTKDLNGVQTSRVLACKVLDLKEYRQSHDPLINTAIERILGECDLLKDLKHPNVVQMEHVFNIHDPNTGFPFVRVLMFMDLCDGDLHSMIRKSPNKRLTDTQALQVMKQVCSGLKYLHDQNIVHFDLKPRNILTLNDQQQGLCIYKLTDFGLGRRFQMGVPTMVNKAMGTQKYKDPALDDPGMSDAKKADIYSLGISLAHMLVGGKDMEKCRDDFKPLGSQRISPIILLREMARLSTKWQISVAAANLIRKMTFKDWRNRPNIDQVIADPWIARP